MGRQKAITMAMMLGALYKALMEPSEENARKAAEEVAGYDSRLAKIEADLLLLKWMVATGLGVQVGLGLLILGKIW
jgi:hypothetical protein